MNKKLMILALAIFGCTACAAVVVNSLTGVGLYFNYSISRYVGLRTWSAIVFAIGNFIVVGAMLKYLYSVAENWGMARWVYWLIIVMLIALIGLSVCPIGYFDPVGARYGTSSPSLIHGLCSRIMFASMLVMMLVVALCMMASKWTRISAVMFLAYGTVCLYGYFSHVAWFENTVLVFESLYLVSFMVLCLGFKGNNEVLAKGMKHGRAKG